MKVDRTTVAGLAVVGLSAAVLTFTTLRALALSCGFTEWLSWLVPVTVDAAGLVALRIWMREGVPFARRLTLSCIGLSVAGNAAQHGLGAYGLTVPWWVIVVVSAVPPATLAAVVHLVHLVSQDQPTRDDQSGLGGNPQPGLVPGAPDRTGREVETRPVRDALSAPPEPVQSLEPGPVRPAEDPLLVGLVRWSETDGVPSRNAVMKRFGVGTSRATRLLEQLAKSPVEVS
jgi:hypothetical protein